MSGRGNGVYDPGATVTAVEAASMMMRALGYFQYTEDYADGFNVVTVRQGSQIGIFNGVGTDANTPMTRNQVAQMALNALESEMVTFTGTPGINANGVSVGYRAEYTPRTSTELKYRAIEDRTSDASDDSNHRGQYYIQLGEELYNGKLTKKYARDDFERPSINWQYDGKEIGTYVDYDLLIAGGTFYDEVKGSEMYDLITYTTIRDNELLSYTDGVVDSIKKTDLVRSNKNAVGHTGKGVLTEVFFDQSRDEVIITSINTYLAKANSNYNSTNESLSLKVFTSAKIDAAGKKILGSTTQVVDGADVPEAADVEKDNFVLVYMSGKEKANSIGDYVNYTVADLFDVETLSNVAVTKFSTSDKKVVDKLTTDGTEYGTNVMAFYDFGNALETYNGQLLTDMTYNVFLDRYGNAIGVELEEGTKNYVFIAGYDRIDSHISIKTAQAAAIFLDGTMDEITVNVTDTNKGRAYGNDDTVYITAEAGPVDYSHVSDITNDAIIDVKGVYTGIQNVKLELNEDYKQFVNDRKDPANSLHKTDDPVNRSEANAYVYSVYDNDYYIIASVVLGEAQGAAANYAYIVDGVKSERIEYNSSSRASNDVPNNKVISENNLIKNATTAWAKVDGHSVYDVGHVSVAQAYADRLNDKQTHQVHAIEGDGHVESSWNKEYRTSYNRLNGKIELVGRTLYVERDKTYQGVNYDNWDLGLALRSTSTPTLLVQPENNKVEKTVCSSVSEAIGRLADADDDGTNGKQFVGRVVAGLKDDVAEWVVIISDTNLTTGKDPNYDANMYYLDLYNDLSNDNIENLTTVIASNSKKDDRVIQGYIYRNGAYGVCTRYEIPAGYNTVVIQDRDINTNITVPTGATVTYNGTTYTAGRTFRALNGDSITVEAVDPTNYEIRVNGTKVEGSTTAKVTSSITITSTPVDSGKKTVNLTYGANVKDSNKKGVVVLHVTDTATNTYEVVTSGKVQEGWTLALDPSKAIEFTAGVTPVSGSSVYFTVDGAKYVWNGQGIAGGVAGGGGFRLVFDSAASTGTAANAGKVFMTAYVNHTYDLDTNPGTGKTEFTVTVTGTAPNYVIAVSFVGDAPKDGVNDPAVKKAINDKLAELKKTEVVDFVDSNNETENGGAHNAFDKDNKPLGTVTLTQNFRIFVNNTQVKDAAGKAITVTAATTTVTIPCAATDGPYLVLASDWTKGVQVNDLFANKADATLTSSDVLADVTGDLYLVNAYLLPIASMSDSSVGKITYTNATNKTVTVDKSKDLYIPTNKSIVVAGTAVTTTGKTHAQLMVGTKEFGTAKALADKANAYTVSVTDLTKDEDMHTNGSIAAITEKTVVGCTIEVDSKKLTYTGAAVPSGKTTFKVGVRDVITEGKYMVKEDLPNGWVEYNGGLRIVTVERTKDDELTLDWTVAATTPEDGVIKLIPVSYVRGPATAISNTVLDVVFDGTSTGVDISNTANKMWVFEKGTTIQFAEKNGYPWKGTVTPDGGTTVPMNGTSYKATEPDVTLGFKRVAEDVEIKVANTVTWGKTLTFDRVSGGFAAMSTESGKVLPSQPSNVGEKNTESAKVTLTNATGNYCFDQENVPNIKVSEFNSTGYKVTFVVSEVTVVSETTMNFTVEITVEKTA